MRVEPHLGADPVRGPLRDEALADPRPDLESIGIVEPDQAMRRLEDVRPRSVVPAEDDRSRVAMAVAELEDVADRCSPEPVDRLVVVADDRQVALPGRDDLDERGLGAVRVLELIDKHEPEPTLDLGPHARRGAHEPESDCDLIAEIDAAVL